MKDKLIIGVAVLVSIFVCGLLWAHRAPHYQITSDWEKWEQMIPVAPTSELICHFSADSDGNIDLGPYSNKWKRVLFFDANGLMIGDFTRIERQD